MLRSHCLNQDAQDGGAVGNIEGSIISRVGLRVYRHYVVVISDIFIKWFVLLTPGMIQIEEHIAYF